MMRPARRLTRGGEDASPTWSRDGRMIAFQRVDRVMAVSVANGRVRAIARGGDPAWSPDGRLIALTDGRALAVVRPTGSGRRVLYRAPVSPNANTELLDPVWHPGGRSLAVRVVVTHSRSVDERAVIVQRRGGRARTAACFGLTTWSPDGRWVACVFLGRILVFSTRGGKPTDLTRGSQPSWRPRSRAPR